MRWLISSVVGAWLAAQPAFAGPAALHVTYDEAHLDLANHQLQFKVSRPIQAAELVVTGDDGTQLDQVLVELR